jgi:hypothetical protein
MPVRAVAAGCAALTAGWSATHLLTTSPLAPAALGLVCAGVVLLAPRLGWAVAMAALAGLAALQGHTGGAVLLLALTGASTVLLLPVTRLWALPAGAGVLAVVGVTGAWPALAAYAVRRAWQRAILGGVGFLWVAAAGALSPVMLFSTRPRLAAPAVWTRSVSVTLHQVLIPLFESGVLAAAASWALAAAVAPWLVSRRHPLRSLVAVTVWSAVTVATVQNLGPRHLSGAVIGALVGAVVLLGPALPGLFSAARDRAGLLTRVP